MSGLTLGWINNYPMYQHIPVVILLALFLGFHGARLYVWTAFIAGLFWSYGVPDTYWIVAGIPLFIMNVPILRQLLVSSVIMKVFKALNFLPQISETERVA